MNERWSCWVKHARETAGITQVQLAEATGISQQAISAIELGKSEPGVLTALKIARYLKVDPRVLWMETQSGTMERSGVHADTW